MKKSIKLRLRILINRSLIWSKIWSMRNRLALANRTSRFKGCWKRLSNSWKRLLLLRVNWNRLKLRIKMICLRSRLRVLRARTRLLKHRFKDLWSLKIKVTKSLRTKWNPMSKRDSSLSLGFKLKTRILKTWQNKFAVCKRSKWHWDSNFKKTIKQEWI